MSQAYQSVGGLAMARAFTEYLTVASFSFTSNNGSAPDGIEDPFDVVNVASHPGTGLELFTLKGRYTFVHAVAIAAGGTIWNLTVDVVQGKAAENSVQLSTFNTSDAEADSNDVRFTVLLFLVT